MSTHTFKLELSQNIESTELEIDYEIIPGYAATLDEPGLADRVELGNITMDGKNVTNIIEQMFPDFCDMYDELKYSILEGED